MPNPYIDGSEVTGPNFYGAGRKAIIDDILRPDNTSAKHVIFGLRRYGKSSLLSELARRLDPSHLYITWNMNICQDASSTMVSLRTGLVSCSGWAEVGYHPQTLRDMSTPLEALACLTNLANEHSRPLWLLCDECDALPDLRQSEPAMLASLAAYIRSTSIHVVMVGTRPLIALKYADGAANPILEGYRQRDLPPLSEDDVAELVTASQHNGGPDLTPHHDRIYQSTGGHPSLAQKLCLHLYNGESWDSAYQITSTHTDARSGFRQDYQFISPIERQVIHAVNEAGALPKERILATLDGLQQTEQSKEIFISTLLQSGYLRLIGNQYQLATSCFANWLENPNADLVQLESIVSDENIQGLTAPSPSGAPEEERRITILHLSDLHFDDPVGRGKSAADNVHRYKLNAIPRALETDLAEDLKNQLEILPDFIVISGDITYQSQQAGYIESEKFLLKLRAELAKAFASAHPTYFTAPSDHEKNRWGLRQLGSPPPLLYSCTRIVMVPGNHDIARQGTEVVIEESHYRDFYFNIYGRPPHNSLMHWHYDEACDTAIVGFNSARLEPKHQLGFVDIQQFSLARDEIKRLRQAAGRPDDDDRTLRIAVVHHHLVQVIQTQYEEFKENYFGVMMNAEEIIRQLIQQRFSIVLHGHQHMPFTARAQRFFRGRDERTKADSSWQLAICAAGSAGIIHSMVAKEYGANHYNLITIQGGMATITWRRGIQETHGFQSDEEFEVPLHRP